MKKLLYLVVLILLCAKMSFSQATFTGTSGGNWNTAGNWSTNSVPDINVDVIIPNGKSVVINTAAECKSLVFGTGSTNTTISFLNSSQSLFIQNNLTFEAVTSGGGTRFHQININGASLNCGSITMADNESSEESRINISTGSLTVRGNVTFNTSTASENEIVFSGAGIMKIAGTFNNNGTFVQSTATVEYNGTSAQNIRTGSYYNLLLSGTGEKSIVGTINIVTNGSFTLNEESILNGGTNRITATGSNVDVIINGTLRSTNLNGLAANSNATVSNTNAPSLTIGANSTIEYNATSGTQTVTGGLNYKNLNLNGASTKNLSANANITGNLAINAGTFNQTTFTLNLDGNLSGSGTLTLSSGTINIKGNNNHTGTFTRGTSTVNYNGNADQVVRGTTYNNLIISGSGNKNLNGNVTVANNLELQNGDLAIGNNTLTLQGFTTSTNGNIKAGICNAASGNLIITGAGALGNLKFNTTNNHITNLSINRTTSGSVNLISTLYIAGTLTLTSGELVVDDIIAFYGSNTPIARTSGTLTLNSNTTLIFGSCSAAGTAFTLPSNLFTTAPTIKNLIIDRTNSVTLNSQMITVTNEVDIAQGTLNTNSSLTLESNASGTARISKLVGTANISGNVDVRRFIPGGNGKRRWRFIGAPVNTGTGITISQIIDDIHVTGSGTGFDVCSTCGPSLRLYDESIAGVSSNGWTNPASVSTVIPTGLGFELFVRGDRTISNPFDGNTIPNNAVIDFIGTINKGNYTFPLSYTNTGDAGDGFNLVANPYPSQIDWMASTGWTKTNIAGYFWTYNPNNGNYGIFDEGSGLGINSINRHIAIGQSIFVKATSSGASISMTEDVKSNGTPFNFFRMNSVQNTKGHIRLKLIADDNEDETIILFSETATKNSSDKSDATKFFNDRLNFYSKSSNNVNLAINEHPYLSNFDAIDTINLSVFSFNSTTVQPGTYSINLSEIVNLNASMKFDLVDNFNPQRVNLNANNSYSFDITEDANSYGNNRFDLIIYNSTTGINQETVKSNFLVYPNPFDNYLIIKSQNNKSINKVEIYQIDGKLIKEYINNQSNLNLDTSDLNEKNMYLLKVYTDDAVEIIKVMK